MSIEKDYDSKKFLSKSFNRWFVIDKKFISDNTNHNKDTDILDIKINVLKKSKRFENRNEIIINTLSSSMLDAYTSFMSWLIAVIITDPKSFTTEELLDEIKVFFNEIIFNEKYKKNEDHRLLYLYIFQDDIYENILNEIRLIDKKPNRTFLKRSKKINFYHKRNLPLAEQQEIYKNKLKHIVQLLLSDQKDQPDNWIEFLTEEYEQLYEMELDTNGY